MLFKRRKAGKTFGWALLILFVLVLIFEVTGGWQLFEYIFFDDDSVLNLLIYSIIMLLIACGFYFGTYRKITTQKY